MNDSALILMHIAPASGTKGIRGVNILTCKRYRMIVQVNWVTNVEPENLESKYCQRKRIRFCTI